MVIVQINATCGSGSTGKICVAISELLTQNNVENYILYNNGSSDYPLGERYTSHSEIKTAAMTSRLLGNWGFEARSATQKLLHRLDEFKPDVIHLHNLHSHACNLSMLFKWIKENHVKVFWTFHDSWAFTGYCMYYDMAGCDKWKTECHDCRQKKAYSWFFDKSRENFLRKKAVLKDLELMIVTPSRWLADQVKQSFLKDTPVKVIPNGIDRTVFSPTASDFRSSYGLMDRYILLGVAFSWEKRKGQDVFFELSKRLPENYRIVLVGASGARQSELPDNIISIERTRDQKELAAIYTAADVFVNPTREDNFPTVNLEALACGTPVITFDTGGSPETIDESCGVTVKKDDVDILEKEIRRVCETRPFSKEACVTRARAFDRQDRFNEYIDLYLSHSS